MLKQLAFLTVATSATAYTWPDLRLNALDHLRWDQAGRHAGLLGKFVQPCRQFVSASPDSGTNRTNAADWLRTAYHDVATHDNKTGLGGLDASIQFRAETDRPENIGDAFGNTFSVLILVKNRHISLSDALAAAAIFGVEACGGPQIDFRGGRIDAPEGGPAGVPQPEESLQSHTAAFARMGFTPTEMIELVACGHTIGSVQSESFPQIVSNTTTNPDGNAPFDSSPVTYDNHVATEYISGQTNNPLVVGPNITTRSDARIFSSDGNMTMRAFANSPSLFGSTCATLLARMLDTVPSTVTLTEVIEPLPVKPTVSLTHLSKGGFSLNGYVRFWNLDANNIATVNIFWADQSGQPCANCSASMSPYGGLGTSFVGNRNNLWYIFPSGGAVISSTTGISRFWFNVTLNGTTWTEDQGGVGFPLQTDVLAADTSCGTRGPSGFNSIRIDIAVRSVLKPSLVYVIGDSSVAGVAASWPAKLAKPASNGSTYDIYSTTVPGTVLDVLNVASPINAGATINGQNVTDWTSISNIDLPSC